MESESQIAENLGVVRRRIAEAAARAGRDAADVRLIAVTKTVGIEEASALAALGVRDLAENRLEDALEKVNAIDEGVCWHMVGTVQRRKARGIVEAFDRVDSVDRIAVAEALERRCAELGKGLPVLLEINVSGEAAKHGFAPDEAGAALEAARRLEHLTVEGLMTMAPLVEDPEAVRPLFARLRELAQGLGLREISMGMTNDYEVAVEEGATQVRIGTALFG